MGLPRPLPERGRARIALLLGPDRAGPAPPGPGLRAVVAKLIRDRRRTDLFEAMFSAFPRISREVKVVRTFFYQQWPALSCGLGAPSVTEAPSSGRIALAFTGLHYQPRLFACHYRKH